MFRLMTRFGFLVMSLALLSLAAALTFNAPPGPQISYVVRDFPAPPNPGDAIGSTFTVWLQDIDRGMTLPLYHTHRFIHDMQWSPTGEQLALLREVDAQQGDWEILVTGIDGRWHFLHAAEPGIRSMSWSPDGQQIAFAAHVDDVSTLHIATIASGQVEVMPTQNGATDPLWSPDGRWIAYLNDTPDQDLMVLDLANGRERLQLDVLESIQAQRSFDPVSVILPEHLSWSPDGAWLATAVRRYEDGPQDIALLRIDPKNDTFELAAVIPRGNLRGWLTWTPDSASLAVVLVDPPEKQLVLYPAAGEDPMTAPQHIIAADAFHWSAAGLVVWQADSVQVNVREWHGAPGQDAPLAPLDLPPTATFPRWRP